MVTNMIIKNNRQLVTMASMLWLMNGSVFAMTELNDADLSGVTGRWKRLKDGSR